MNIFQRLATWTWRPAQAISGWCGKFTDPPARKVIAQGQIMPPGHIPSSDLRGIPNYPWFGTAKPIWKWEMRARYAIVIVPSLVFIVLLLLTWLLKALGWGLAKVAR